MSEQRKYRSWTAKQKLELVLAYFRGERSIVITSKRSFEAWGEILGDDMAANAIIDRLVHHATMVTLKGKSYRLRERGAGVVPAAPAASLRSAVRPPTPSPLPHGSSSSPPRSLRWRTSASRCRWSTRGSPCHGRSTGRAHVPGGPTAAPGTTTSARPGRAGRSCLTPGWSADS